jgi:flagellar biosynthesis/type III secretory pathway chaperone
MKALFDLLWKEEEALKKMVELAEEQKSALVRYDVSAVEKCAQKLNELAREMKNLEEERISYIANEFKLSKKEAFAFKLSELSNFTKELPADWETRRARLRSLVETLASTNSLNKLLANRAFNGIHEILAMLSNTDNSVCNVKV